MYIKLILLSSFEVEVAFLLEPVHFLWHSLDACKPFSLGVHVNFRICKAQLNIFFFLNNETLR